MRIPSEINPPLLQFICEVCSIETTNQDGLDMHLIGKQHKRMSQKLDIQKKYASLANPSVDPLSGVSYNASSYTVDARGQ